MADRRPRHADEALGDPGDAHQLACQNEQRHREEREVVEGAVELLSQQQHWKLTVDEDDQDRREPHAVGDRQTENQEDEEQHEHELDAHSACSVESSAGRSVFHAAIVKIVSIAAPTGTAK